MRKTLTLASLLALLLAGPASAALYVEDFNVTNDWFPGTTDPVDPGLSSYWDVERVALSTSGGNIGYYYDGKFGDNGQNTPDGSWSLYNNANGHYGSWSNARHLLWTEVTFQQEDVTGFEFDYKGRQSNLTDFHVAAQVGGQMYISVQSVNDTRGDRTLPYLHATFNMEDLTWIPITLARLDYNTDLGVNANADGIVNDKDNGLAWQSNPTNLAPLFGVLPDELPAGDIEAVGLYFASGSHIDGEYVQNKRATVYVDNFTVVPEPATMSLLALGGLVALRRRRR
jgi:hypothetical protein